MSDGSAGPVGPLWREEFPVDAASENYVSRRQFAKFLVLGSAGMLVGNVWIAVKAARVERRTFVPLLVAKADEVPVGGTRVFAYPGEDDPCLLVHLDEDTWVAYDQKCTHLSCAVYFHAQSREIRCPCHEGHFAARDGRVLAGPPQRPLPRVVLERRGDALFAVGIEQGED